MVAEGFHFLEGPRWRNDTLYVSDMFGSAVYSVSEAGDCRVVCQVPGQPSGLGFDPDGALLVVSMQDRLVLRHRDGTLQAIADLSEHASGPANDMVVDSAGRAYVGTFGVADEDGGFPPSRLLRVEPNGTVAVAASDMCFPNGAALADAGRQLIVAETYAHRLTSFDVARDGTLSNRRVWLDFATPDVISTARGGSGPPVRPDGLAMDASGAVWVADAHGSGALRVGADGRVLDTICTEDLAVYALALGGPDGRTLFLCVAPSVLVTDPREHALARLMSCRVEVPACE